MRWSTPTVRQGLLTFPGETQDNLIAVGSAPWYSWLETATLFSFSDAQGNITVRKEQRQRGGWYWKAYCTYHGKLARVYLGKTEHLTWERLEQAARTLAEHSSLAKSDVEQPHQSPNMLLDAPSQAQSDVLLSPDSAGDVRADGLRLPVSVQHEALLSVKVVVPPLRPNLVL